MQVRADGNGWKSVGATTTDLVELNGCRGIDNPLRRLRVE
jgi:hypothetical protein